MKKNPAPPLALGKHGLALWGSILAYYEVQDSADLEALAQACAARERADQCRVIIDRKGALVQTPAGPREHPLLKHELAARAFVVKTLRGLGLGGAEPSRSGPGRPPAKAYPELGD
jgi:hypothetical protein